MQTKLLAVTLAVAVIVWSFIHSTILIAAPRPGYMIGETTSNDIGGVKTWYGTQHFGNAFVDGLPGSVVGFSNSTSVTWTQIGTGGIWQATAIGGTGSGTISNLTVSGGLLTGGGTNASVSIGLTTNAIQGIVTAYGYLLPSSTNGFVNASITNGLILAGSLGTLAYSNAATYAAQFAPNTVTNGNWLGYADTNTFTVTGGTLTVAGRGVSIAIPTQFDFGTITNAPWLKWAIGSNEVNSIVGGTNATVQGQLAGKAATNQALSLFTGSITTGQLPVAGINTQTADGTQFYSGIATGYNAGNLALTNIVIVQTNGSGVSVTASAPSGRQQTLTVSTNLPASGITLTNVTTAQAGSITGSGSTYGIGNALPTPAQIGAMSNTAAAISAAGGLTNGQGGTVGAITNNQLNVNLNGGTVATVTQTNQVSLKYDGQLPNTTNDLNGISIDLNPTQATVNQYIRNGISIYNASTNVMINYVLFSFTYPKANATNINLGFYRSAYTGMASNNFIAFNWTNRVAGGAAQYSGIFTVSVNAASTWTNTTLTVPGWTNVPAGSTIQGWWYGSPYSTNGASAVEWFTLESEAQVW